MKKVLLKLYQDSFNTQQKAKKSSKKTTNVWHRIPLSFEI